MIKNWEFLKRESLFVHFDVCPRKLRWTYTNELIGYENSFQIKSLNFLRHDLTKHYFANIKKLAIFDLDLSRTGQSVIAEFEQYISHFEQLEQLELNGFHFLRNNRIALPRLKILTLKEVSNNSMGYVIELSTPNLEVFVCWKRMYNVRFIEYPSKLRYLQCINDYPRFKFNMIFAGVEHLNLFDVTGQIENDFLDAFPNLKKLNLYNNFNATELEDFRARARSIGLDDLKVLFLGFDEGVYVRQPIGYNYMFMLQTKNIKSLHENYSKLNEIVPWPVYLDYCELVQKFNRDLPGDFLRKFVNINTVYVGKLDDHESLIDFLNNCGHVKHLRISYSTLKQAFFDQLPFASISILEITNEDTGNIQNFKFISKLKICKLVVKWNILPIDLVQNVLDNKDLRYFIFMKESLHLFIDRLDDVHHLGIDHTPVLQTNKSDDIVNCLKKNKKIKEIVRG